MAATESWPRHEIIALAGLIAEGNTCHPGTLYFYGNDRAMIDDFADAICQFPNTAAKVYTRPGSRRMEVQADTGVDRRFKKSAGRRGVATLAPPSRSGAFLWAESLGITGRKATAKRVPTGVFRLCDADLELFLGRLWAGDGFIANDTLKVPFYATSSRGLAEDVQHLLLRLGIVSRIHAKQFRYRGGLRPGYTVHVLGDGGVETFLARVAPHCLGRDSAVNRLREYVGSTTRGLTSKDTIPLDVRERVNAERLKRGLSWVEVEAQSGVSMQEFYGPPPTTKTGFRRSTIAKLAEFLDSNELRAIATSDVFWDRVVSVEYVGVEDTYDLTVEEDHNFVADGLVVHNSHTAAYAQIGYQTAYLKTHYTAEFMAALLSSEIDEGNKRELMVDHIADARKLGVEVEAPNVNKGQPDFDVVNGKIVFGLTAIKGLGRGAAEEIVRAREKGETFRDLSDLCARVNLKVVKPAQLEKVIMAGAMDCFSKNRNALMHALPKAVQEAEDKAEDKRRGQKNMFDLFDEADDGGGPADGRRAGGELPDVAPWPELEKLKKEKEVLDFYMSSHPLAQYDEQLRRFRSHDAAQCAKLNAGTEVRLAGMVVELIPKLVSKGRNAGNRWAIVRIEDFSGSVKCILWSDQFQRFGDEVKADAILLFDGKVEWREGSGEPDVIVERVLTVEQAKAELTRGVVLRMAYRTDDDGRQTFDTLGKILKQAKGPCPVYLAVHDPAGRSAQFKLHADYFVNPTQVPVEQLEMILGPGAVLFTGR